MIYMSAGKQQDQMETTVQLRKNVYITEAPRMTKIQVNKQFNLSITTKEENVGLLDNKENYGHNNAYDEMHN